MKRVLIDTDVIIDYLRLGQGWLEELLEMAGNHEIKLCMSTITILELFSGDMGKDQKQIVVDIEKNIEMVPLDKEMAKYLGALRRSVKYAISTTDLVIGGSAVFLEAEVATRNRKHFAHIKGLKFFEYGTE